MAFGRKKEPAPTLGYKQGFADLYELEKELGKGGNGVVRLARHKATGGRAAARFRADCAASPGWVVPPAVHACQRQRRVQCQPTVGAHTSCPRRSYCRC